MICVYVYGRGSGGSVTLGFIINKLSKVIFIIFIIYVIFIIIFVIFICVIIDDSIDTRMNFGVTFGVKIVIFVILVNIVMIMMSFKSFFQ